MYEYIEIIVIIIKMDVILVDVRFNGLNDNIIWIKIIKFIYIVVNENDKYKIN